MLSIYKFLKRHNKLVRVVCAWCKNNKLPLYEYDCEAICEACLLTAKHEESVSSTYKFKLLKGGK